MAAEPGDEGRADLEDAPPLLGSWRNIYLVVLGSQALLILAFYLLTVAFE
jgi:hypothetical protein